MKSLLLPLLAALALPTGINAEISNLKDSYIQQKSLKVEKLSYCTKLAKEAQYRFEDNFIYVDNSDKVWEVNFFSKYPYQDKRFNCRKYQVGVIGKEYKYSEVERYLKLFNRKNWDYKWVVKTLHIYENQKLIRYSQADKYDIVRSVLKKFNCDQTYIKYGATSKEKELAIKNCVEFRSE